MVTESKVTMVTIHEIGNCERYFFFSCKVEGKLTVLPGDIQEASMVWTDPNIT